MRRVEVNELARTGCLQFWRRIFFHQSLEVSL